MRARSLTKSSRRKRLRARRRIDLRARQAQRPHRPTEMREPAPRASCGSFARRRERRAHGFQHARAPRRGSKSRDSRAGESAAPRRRPRAWDGSCRRRTRKCQSMSKYNAAYTRERGIFGVAGAAREVARRPRAETSQRPSRSARDDPQSDAENRGRRVEGQIADNLDARFVRQRGEIGLSGSPPRSTATLGSASSRSRAGARQVA